MAGENVQSETGNNQISTKATICYIFLRLFSRSAMPRENDVGEGKVVITENYYNSWRNACHPCLMEATRTWVNQRTDQLAIQTGRSRERTPTRIILRLL